MDGEGEGEGEREDEDLEEDLVDDRAGSRPGTLPRAIAILPLFWIAHLLLEDPARALALYAWASVAIGALLLVCLWIGGGVIGVARHPPHSWMRWALIGAAISAAWPLILLWILID